MKFIKTQGEDKLKLFINSKTINERIKIIAKKINSEYQGKTPVFIGILNGSFIFLSDLVRKLNINVEIDFLNISSYGQNSVSSGDIRLLETNKCMIKGKDVIVVEDIIDTGNSMKMINELLLNQQPKSLEYITLLFKKDISNLDFKIKYIGFKIPNRFVVGYGLDYAQKYRNLKSIYILNN